MTAERVCKVMPCHGEELCVEDITSPCESRKSKAKRSVASTQRTCVKIHHDESFHGCRVEPETEEERSLGATGTLQMQTSESLQVQNWLEAPRESTLGQKAVD